MEIVFMFLQVPGIVVVSAQVHPCVFLNTETGPFLRELTIKRGLLPTFHSVYYTSQQIALPQNISPAREKRGESNSGSIKSHFPQNAILLSSSWNACYTGYRLLGLNGSSSHLYAKLRDTEINRTTSILLEFLVHGNLSSSSITIKLWAQIKTFAFRACSFKVQLSISVLPLPWKAW